jgi:hypothetical protein
MTSNEDQFVKYEKSSQNYFVLLGDDSKLAIIGYGQITFKLLNNEKILVKDVLHIPSL